MNNKDDRNFKDPTELLMIINFDYIAVKIPPMCLLSTGEIRLFLFELKNDKGVKCDRRYIRYLNGSK